MRLVLLLFFVALGSSVRAETDLTQARSSDLVAEIEFLNALLPIPQRLGGSDRQAFEDYLTSYSICEEMDFVEYEEFVISFEQLFGGESPMRIGQRSYAIRSENGCAIDLEAERMVESYVGPIAVRNAVLESLSERRNE